MDSRTHHNGDLPIRFGASPSQLFGIEGSTVRAYGFTLGVPRAAGGVQYCNILNPVLCMTPAQFQLARHRLWLGITNVGLWVLFSCAGLYWLAFKRVDAPGAPLLLAIGAVAIAAQAVFDLVGGVVLMPVPRASIRTFLPHWLRGALGHTLALATVGMVSAFSLRLTGGFGAGVAVAMVALALGRRHVLRAIAGAATQARTYDGAAMLTVAVNDPAFTGGVVGFGSRAKILIPESWLATLSKAELDAEVYRRQWQIANAMAGRAFLLLLVWSLLGSLSGTYLFDLAQRTPAAALFGHACWMTLWAFTSLLVLPVLSRRAVFAADKAAAESGHDPRNWIVRFADLVGEDGNSNNAVQTIFYPVPSTERRLEHLARSASGFVPGNLARSFLYYSWATFTPLGRAVHCNVGRPALWVYPPSA